MVRLTAPPVDGEANAALTRFLGRSLGVAPSSIEIARGASSREKLVRIDGLTAGDVVRLLLGEPR